MKAEQSNARNILPRLPQGAGSNLKSYSPTQLHFLMRLSHLQRQRRDMVNVADGADWHMRLVNKALSHIGISGPYWTTSPGWIKPTIAIMDVWACGGTMVILPSRFASSRVW